ncbi:MAG: divalent-cation tolerance protein CutA [Bdellovibrionales bacterium]|nr:divalent-cation tolerance protein CutA [Bdellovibrionales bacterium]
MKYVFAYITTANEEEAERIGRQLVEKKLAACVNIIPGMRSFYWWQGQVDSGQETVLIAKTREDLVAPATALVKALHSYSCPCVVTWELKGGNEEYFEWLGKSLEKN